jgi:hypothetical protein
LSSTRTPEGSLNDLQGNDRYPRSQTLNAYPSRPLGRYCPTIIIDLDADRSRRMRFIARQFGLPSGPLGRAVGRLLARTNAAFNRWLVAQVAAAVPTPHAVVELGSVREVNE